MNRFFHRRLGLVALVLLAVLTSGVLRSAAQGPKTLVIGVISGIGSETSHGVQLAVSRFNSRGNTTVPGGQTYRLEVQERDANTPAEVESAIRDLKNAGAVAIFGPDLDELTQASQSILVGAGIPVFTSATNPNVQTTGSVFRTRASDTRQMAGFAIYTASDLNKEKIAIFQGDSFSSSRVTLYATSLGQLGKTPATTVLQMQGGALSDSAAVLIGSAPDLVVAFGAADQAAQLLRELRSQGYNGPFAYPDAVETAFRTALSADLRAGVIGASNWVYSAPTSVAGEFVRDYVALFGEVPTGKSVAAYDAAGGLIIAASRGGIAPDGLIKALLALPRVESIQGHFNATLGSNELSADVYAYETGAFGAPVVKARYDETGKGVIPNNPVPLPTLVSTAAPATATPLVPPTPQGVTARPKNSALNVRSGPGTNYERIGQLRSTDVVQVLGVSPDQAWLAIDFAGGRGWIQSSLTTVTGALSTIPILEPPPSPTPPPFTPTPSAQPFPDLVPISVVLNPPQLKVGQPFVASVTIQNRGSVNSGQFAVAASWQPGNVYSAATVGSLAAGQSTTVNLNVSGVIGGTGSFTVEVVVDLNNEVNEGPNEGNNKLPVGYTVVP